jgi:hypothetical protein
MAVLMPQASKRQIHSLFTLYGPSPASGISSRIFLTLFSVEIPILPPSSIHPRFNLPPKTLWVILNWVRRVSTSCARIYLTRTLTVPTDLIPIGQGTATDGVNWVGYLATTYNKTVTLSYNFAVYGATVNDSVVYSEPEDLVYQISHDFCGHYCPPPLESNNRTWATDTSLFAIWVGINEYSTLRHSLS